MSIPTKKFLSELSCFDRKEKNLEYLTVKETAKLKGCSERYIKTLCKDGKIQAEQELNCKGRMKYMIPVSSLSEKLQEKYYRKKRTEAGILPEKTDSENDKKQY